MSAPAPSTRSRLAELVAAPEAELDLATAALLIAAEEYPQLTPDPYLHRLDLLAERVKDRLANETAPPLVLQEASRVLFQGEGFRGNVENYYDPRNLFLNDVLDRRLGIPITLSLVYLEVGWRLGLPLSGVNFPNHFLVRYEGEAKRLLVDPFHGGVARFEDDAQLLLDQAYGGTLQLQPNFLRTAGKRDILVRILNNLKQIYMNARDDRRALAAIERLLLITPGAHGELRDRGMLLARMGRKADALTDLRRYLDFEPAAPDGERVRRLIAELSRQEERDG